jgi:hypothetical protein
MSSDGPRWVLMVSSKRIRALKWTPWVFQKLNFDIVPRRHIPPNNVIVSPPAITHLQHIWRYIPVSSNGDCPYLSSCRFTGFHSSFLPIR